MTRHTQPRHSNRRASRGTGNLACAVPYCAAGTEHRPSNHSSVITHHCAAYNYSRFRTVL